MPAKLEASLEFATEMEKEDARESYSQPHVRVRPDVARRTIEELTPERSRRKRRWNNRGNDRPGESHTRLPHFVVGP